MRISPNLSLAQFFRISVIFQTTTLFLGGLMLNSNWKDLSYFCFSSSDIVSSLLNVGLTQLFPIYPLLRNSIPSLENYPNHSLHLYIFGAGIFGITPDPDAYTMIRRCCFSTGEIFWNSKIKGLSWLWFEKEAYAKSEVTQT